MSENQNHEPKIEPDLPNTQLYPNPNVANPQPSSTVPLPQHEPNLLQKRSRSKKIYFIFLAIANLVTIVFPLLATIWLVGQARSGVSGTEYFGILLIPLQLLGVAVAFLNIITISRFVRKEKPRHKIAIIGKIIVICSVLYLVLGAVSVLSSVKSYWVFNRTISEKEAISLINSCKIVSISRQNRLVLFTKHDPSSKNPNDYQRYAADKDFYNLKTAAKVASEHCGHINVTDLPENYHNQDITIEQATDLLRSNCEIKFFYYTTKQLGDLNIIDPETSTTGIVLASKEDPTSIFIVDRLIPQLVPIASEARKKCPDLKIWHDGGYERQDSSGNWQ
jgi:hypothetical protein